MCGNSAVGKEVVVDAKRYLQDDPSLKKWWCVPRETNDRYTGCANSSSFKWR